MNINENTFYWFALWVENLFLLPRRRDYERFTTFSAFPWPFLVHTPICTGSLWFSRCNPCSLYPLCHRALSVYTSYRATLCSGCSSSCWHGDRSLAAVINHLGEAGF